MKRSWGFTYIMTKKGKEKASADVGFMFLAYALRRIFNILDFNLLDAYFEGSKASFWVIKWFWPLPKALGLDFRASQENGAVLADKLSAA